MSDFARTGLMIALSQSGFTEWFQKYVVENHMLPSDELVKAAKAEAVAAAHVRTEKEHPYGFFADKHDREAIVGAGRIAVDTLYMALVAAYVAGKVDAELAAQEASKYVYTIDGKEFDTRQAATDYIRTTASEWPTDSIHMLSARARGAPEWHSATVAVYQALPDGRMKVRAFPNWEQTLNSLSEETEGESKS